MPSPQGMTDLSIAPSPLPNSPLPSSPRSAYLHIPFCRRRCYYCDFPITVVGDRPPVAQGGSAERINGNNSPTIAHYVEVLCQEIQAIKPGDILETVFLGGGTPSLLSVAQLHQILATLDRQFGLSSTAEISMEVDPGTFDLAQLQGYRSAGVNRVSLGVQAFQPQLLSACGRSHTVAEVYAAIDQVQQAGFHNFSVDLISGLPHQTLADWQHSLEQAIALGPSHISCYDLTIEPITPFGRQYKPGLTPLPSDETTAQMYRLAQQILTAAGYSHYEISNYAQPGFQCRHNRVYWENRPFYGFGMGATSCVGGDRISRPRKTREYYDWVAALPASLGQPEPQSLDDRLLETLMLGLRLAEGLRVDQLRQQFGLEMMQRVERCLLPYIQQGWVTGTIDPLARIQLTDPEGFLFSNQVLADLFEEFEE
jgi:putative oxygen-independent coproporphyrinogen III oxidase